MLIENKTINYAAHILVVDDDKRLNNLLEKFLKDNDHYVDTAENAISARKKISVVAYDIIILDIMMPGENGLDLLNFIRKNNDTPVLMLSAMKDTENRIIGFERGADDYLEKPFEPKELILRIKNILDKTKKNNQKRVIEFDNIKIDLNKLQIIQNNKEFKINNNEKFA